MLIWVIVMWNMQCGFNNERRSTVAGGRPDPVVHFWLTDAIRPHVFVSPPAHTISSRVACWPDLSGEDYLQIHFSSRSGRLGRVWIPPPQDPASLAVNPIYGNSGKISPTLVGRVGCWSEWWFLCRIECHRNSYIIEDLGHSWGTPLKNCEGAVTSLFLKLWRF